MDTKQLERIDYLLDSNEMMYNGLLFGDYGERNSDSFRGARESCRKNLTKIREILGIRELRKQQAIDAWLETCKTILDNKEDMFMLLNLAGFTNIKEYELGVSTYPELKGLEDRPDCSLVVEVTK